MGVKVFYNENNAFAAGELKKLGQSKLLVVDNVDDRSIEDIKVSDLDGFERIHFFAGIGGWEYALKLTGWPEGVPVWTGSCPCQPFSNAGKGRGNSDSRHLWPIWFKLIKKCQPPIIFGEQVASKLGREWLCDLRSDLEGLGYEVGAADLCAASIGAPHTRQRLWWFAYTPVHRLKRYLCKVEAQKMDNRPLKTLDTWHGSGHPFENWRKLLGKSQSRRMADGVPSTLDIRPRLHAYGNSIVPGLGAVFIKTCLQYLLEQGNPPPDQERQA